MKQLTKVLRKSGKNKIRDRKPGLMIRLWFLPGLLILISVGCNKENIRPRDLFGYWTCSETSEVNGSRGYTVFIDQYGSELDKIIIDNFYDLGYGNKVIAVLQAGKLTIEEQEVKGLTYSGTGEVTGLKNKITFDYTVVADTLQDHIIAEYKH